VGSAAALTVRQDGVPGAQLVSDAIAGHLLAVLAGYAAATSRGTERSAVSGWCPTTSTTTGTVVTLVIV
jgi:hypothetical protein